MGPDMPCKHGQKADQFRVPTMGLGIAMPAIALLNAGITL